MAELASKLIGGRWGRLARGLSRRLSGAFSGAEKEPDREEEGEPPKKRVRREHASVDEQGKGGARLRVEETPPCSPTPGWLQPLTGAPSPLSLPHCPSPATVLSPTTAHLGPTSPLTLAGTLGSPSPMGSVEELTTDGPAPPSLADPNSPITVSSKGTPSSPPQRKRGQKRTRGGEACRTPSDTERCGWGRSRTDSDLDEGVNLFPHLPDGDGEPKEPSGPRAPSTSPGGPSASPAAQGGRPSWTTPESCSPLGPAPLPPRSKAYAHVRSKVNTGLSEKRGPHTPNKPAVRPPPALRSVAPPRPVSVRKTPTTPSQPNRPVPQSRPVNKTPYADVPSRLHNSTVSSRGSTVPTRPHQPTPAKSGRSGAAKAGSGRGSGKGGGKEPPDHPLLKRCKRNMGEAGFDDDFLVSILRSVVDDASSVSFDSVTGLAQAKRVLNLSVIMPMKRPELFQGARTPSKGLLLFGPPGNGKTMVARAVASQCEATFLSVSASTLTSKWFGDGEKLVSALFAVARALQPTIIFIDEVDSLLTSRSSSDHEASRRIKTEFLAKTDGVAVSKDDWVFIMGATNRPHDLDDAVIRRFTKRVYIPLPEPETRDLLLKSSFGGVSVDLSERDWKDFVQRTEGYSCSDLSTLCQDIALRPLSEMGEEQMLTANSDHLRPITMKDVLESLEENRPSVSLDATSAIERWNAKHGSKVPENQIA